MEWNVILSVGYTWNQIYSFNPEKQAEPEQEAFQICGLKSARVLHEKVHRVGKECHSHDQPTIDCLNSV